MITERETETGWEPHIERIAETVGREVWEVTRAVPVELIVMAACLDEIAGHLRSVMAKARRETWAWSEFSDLEAAYDMARQRDWKQEIRVVMAKLGYEPRAEGS